jgi:hypothetical protein
VRCAGGVVKQQQASQHREAPHPWLWLQVDAAVTAQCPRAEVGAALAGSQPRPGRGAGGRRDRAQI